VLRTLSARTVMVNCPKHSTSAGDAENGWPRAARILLRWRALTTCAARLIRTAARYNGKTALGGQKSEMNNEINVAP